MTFSPDASDVYRTHVTKFVPSSGYNEPSLDEIRALLAQYEAVMNAFTTNGGLIYTTMAAMNAAATTFTEPRSAWQFEAGSEGIYALNPTTDIWTKVGRLPYNWIPGTDTGAGTANAIQITTDTPVADGMVVMFSLFRATTSSPVTVSINGGAALTLKTNRGNDASSLAADMEIWGRVRSSDNTFRMLNDQDVSALVAQAEAALSEFETHYLGAYTTAGQPTLDNEGNALAVGALYWNSTESEMRVWDGGTWQSFGGGLADGSVTDAKLATASAVQNRTDGYVDVRDPGYGAGAAETGATNRTAVQAAMDAASTAGVAVVFTESLDVDDELKTSSNLHLRGNGPSFLRQQSASSIGAFLHNLRNSSADAATIQSNILLEHVNITGEDLPDPYVVEVASAAGTSVTFTAAASAVDDFYNGLWVQDTTAANSGLRAITDYDGATRTATLTSAWSSDPVAGTDILIGSNENATGYAAGLSDFLSIGGISKGYPASKQIPAGLGGKGFGFEQGVTNAKVIGRHAEDCGTAFFVQGVDGSMANGSKKRTVRIELSTLSAKNCGSALTIAGVNTTADPDGDSDDSLIIVDGLTYENAGHSPYRLVLGGQAKSGILNFLEAQNASVSNVRGRNDSGYPDVSPGYPTDYTTRVGYGLSGNIGAMIWGWGRNLKVDSFVHHGAVDNVIAIRRGRALGDDAGPTTAPRNCFNWDFRGIEHHGTINEYVVRIDPLLASRVDPTELTGQIDVSVNGSLLTGGIVDPNMSAHSSITLTVRDHVSGKTIIGTPAQIYAAGNTFASYGSGVTDLRRKTLENTSVRGLQYTLLDDTAIGVDPPHPYGIVAIAGNISLLRALVDFRTTGGAQCVCIGTEPSNFTALNTDGALTGTTGTDGDFTVRANATDGKLYLENRRGSTVTFFLTFIG